MKRTTSKKGIILKDQELARWEKILAAETYHTRLRGFSNPFEPFFRERSRGRKKRVALSPLERWTLQELRLTGIVKKNGRRWALIEDPSGKGYFVSVGTRIGPNQGYITRIGKDFIMVRERVVDFLGREKVREIKISLRPTEEAHEVP
ncbi:pilus assembly protein PilP [Thermosulfurimonas sp. F29]|uniref:pilus assembly protein PilP n=1 Tax=Thermosulfurimonas sp. F29 TaxID=2867247 RepID=UPI001C840A8C|nr:pilus assembly protein PilP [Thermosulfurimonas sp. F29]MBX6423654.1 pilus assembly protein PilP [Thermosulfurimonas sp. F29]